MNLLKRLPPFDPKSGTLNVVIDTPKGCRSKFAYDMKRKAYVLKSVLPQGALFPFDFGSIPGRVADDGDPLDALVLMDEPAFCGCLIESRLVGVIEAEQSEDGKTERNDRLIAVAAKSQIHADIKALSDLSPALLNEIAHFFISYNQERGKKFRPVGLHGRERMMEWLDQSTRDRKWKGMAGLIEEGWEMIDDDAEDEVRDAGLIAAAQRVEHYGIAGYGCVRTYAELLGDSKGAELLQQTLDEEGATDKKLTELAKTLINIKAQ